MNKILTSMLTLGLILTATVSAQQTSTGSITGTVTDPSGQVVPGATVKLVSEISGEERQGQASEVGDFTFSALQPGPYTVRVDAAGFRSYEQKNNILLAATRLALPRIQLEVGSVTESVVVSAVGAQVQTTTSAVTKTIDGSQMQMIATKGRDPMSVFKTMPGVALISDQDTMGGGFQSTVPQFQGRGGNTVYTDGVNGGDGGGGGNFSGITSMDAIAEVNVQANSYTADQGFKGGAQINLITKRGGSEYHGTAAWFKRHEQFNAREFFSNAQGSNADGSPRARKPRYRYSDLSGTIGGPIPFKIPILNPDGKSFNFFYQVQDMRSRNVPPLRFWTMPTALERNGDYSQSRQPNGTLIPVVDPLNNNAQFPGNIVPQARRNELGVGLLNLFPLPNTFGVGGHNYLSQENSFPFPRRAQLFRFDIRPTQKDTISVKYQNWFTSQKAWEVSGASTRWGVVRQFYNFTSDQGKIDYTRIISPHLIAEASVGVFYSTETGPPADELALASVQRQYDRAAALGTCAPPCADPANGTLKPGPLAGLRQIAPVHNPLNLLPRIQFGSVQSNNQELGVFSYDGRWPIDGADTSMPIRADVTYTKGSHVFKAGVTRIHERFAQARSGNFGGQFNFANDNNDPANLRYAYANAFTGHVTEYSESMGRRPDNRWQNTWAFYVTDQWKLTRRLTMDIGVRIYKWGPSLAGSTPGQGEASAFSFERFDPTWGGKPPVLYRPTLNAQGQRRALNPLTGDILPVPFIGLMVPGTGYSCGVITPTTPCKVNGIVVQDDPTYSNTGQGFLDSIPLQWDPRVGFAWDPFGNGKTVLRFGAGVYHDSTGGALFNGGLAYAFEQSIRYTDMNTYFDAVGPTSVSGTSGAWRQNHKRPLTYQYNFGIQRDIGWNTIIDVGYVGSSTHHNSESWDFNATPAGWAFLPQNRDTTINLNPNNPAAASLPENFVRPYVGFGGISISGPATTSRYDSLQVSANRRFTRGVEISGAYTYAGGTSNGWNQSRPLSSSLARGRNGVQQHVAVFSYILDLPKGSRMMPGIVTRAILDNWQFIGLSQFANGGAANVTAGYADNINFTGGGETCGSLNHLGRAILPRSERSITKWFDTSAFGPLTGLGDIGNNCHEAKIRNPGFHQHDLALSKIFPMKNEKRFFTFRWETFNTFNHTQFNAVDTSAQFSAPNAQGVRTQTDTNFGRVTSARPARTMVFGLKFNF